MKTTFGFGKYKGQLISEIATTDPQYIRWLITESDCNPFYKKALAKTYPEVFYIKELSAKQKYQQFLQNIKPKLKIIALSRKHFG